jgi:hypothetical protein
LENKKVKKSVLKQAAAAAIAAAFAAPAFGANIVLIDSTNSFASAPHGAEALFAFQKAANYWNQTLTNNVTIRINIGFEDLGSNVLGSTGSTVQDVKVSSVYNALATSGNSALDSIAVAHLTPLNADGSLNMRVNAYVNAATQSGVNLTAASRISNSSNYINNYLSANTAVVKAMGLTAQYDASNTKKYDAEMTFSSTFGFDFNPTDGIATGKYDFTAVAVHEIGHALGFVSGADTFDLVGGKGPYTSLFNAGAFGSSNIDDFSIGSTLDLFRYGNNPGGAPQLNWAANKTTYFSIDGTHVFNLPDDNQAAAFFSTGAYNGDGQQASHWKDNLAVLDESGVCFQSSRSVGIMDPTIAACSAGSVTQNDLAAFDAMGWNLNQNILANPTYKINTTQIYQMDGLAAAVPEPETYAMLLAGLGLTALVARRRKSKAA